VAVAICVFCRRQPVDPRWRPFCSQRCQIQDLARWADGRYAVPGDKVPEQDDDAQTTVDDRRSEDWRSIGGSVDATASPQIVNPQIL